MRLLPCDSVEFERPTPALERDKLLELPLSTKRFSLNGDCEVAEVKEVSVFVSEAMGLILGD